MPPQKIRTAMAAIREKVKVGDPLKELKVFSVGKRVRVEIAGQHMEPVSGQLLFNFDQKELRRLLAFPEKSKSDRKAQREAAERWFQKGLELEQTGAPIEQARLLENESDAFALDRDLSGRMIIQAGN